MIKVAPPKGWVPPAPAPDESKLQTQEGDSCVAGETLTLMPFSDLEKKQIGATFFIPILQVLPHQAAKICRKIHW